MNPALENLSNTSQALLLAGKEESKNYGEFISAVEAAKDHLSDVDIVAVAMQDNPLLGTIRSAIEMTLLRTAVDDEVARSLKKRLTTEKCQLFEETSALLAHAEVLLTPDDGTTQLPAPPLFSNGEGIWRRLVRPSFIKFILCFIPLAVILLYGFQIYLESASYGGRLLHMAAANNRLYLAKALVSAGWEINPKGRVYISPIGYAASNGNLEMLTYLFDNGADVHLHGVSNNVQLACLGGNYECVKLILDKGGRLDYNRRGTIASHVRLPEGTAIVDLLIKRGYRMEHEDWHSSLGKVPFEKTIEWLNTTRKTHGEKELTRKNALIELATVAVKRINTKYLSKLVRQGVRATDVSVDGKSLLMHSCHNRTKPVFDYLLPSYNDVNAHKDNQGQTALFHACTNLSSEFTEALIKAGAKINLRSKSGRTPLHEACRAESGSSVRLLIKHKAHVKARADDGDTPLHSIVENAYVSDSMLNNIELLVRRGADINARNKVGLTPLAKACVTGSEYAFKKLLSLGAETEVCDNDGNSPLHLAIKNRSRRIAFILIEKELSKVKNNKNNESPLYWALKNRLSVIALKLMKNANLFEKTNNGSSLMHAAAKSMPQEVLEILEKRGLSLDEQNNEGQTPLHIALANEHAKAVWYLLPKGVSLEKRDKRGNGPLHFVSSEFTLMNLLEKNIPIDEQNKDGMTPLMVAVRYGREWTYPHFLKYKASVLKKDREERTILHLACLNNASSSAVSEFVKSGADLEAKDNHGFTPLLYACQKGHVHLVETLLQLGANRDAQSNDGRSALELTNNIVIRGLVMAKGKS